MPIFLLHQILKEMEQTFHIQGHAVKVTRDLQERSFVSRQLHFINEADATFFLPFQDGTFIHHAEAYLTHVAKHYDTLKQQSLKAIGAEALKGGYWGKRLAENPELDLVWVKVIASTDEDSAIELELAFNSARHDAYTLWITFFHNLELKEVKRQAW